MNKVYQCFPGGKHKALTMSYDDGKVQDRRLIEIFNKYGIKGTFHINSGLFHDPKRIQPEEIRELYKGHEVSCHTVTHPTIARCPLPNVVEEVLADRRALEECCGYPVRGLSYPTGSVTKDIEALLPMCGIRYSRVVGSSGHFGRPPATTPPVCWNWASRSSDCSSSSICTGCTSGATPTSLTTRTTGT